MKILAATIVLAAAVSSIPASAESPVGAGASEMTAIMACKQVVDPAKRLQCFDQAVTTAEQAQAAETQMQTERREQQVAGFGLPSKPDPQSVDRIQSSIVSITFNTAAGTALVALENGQLWRTTSNGTLTNRLRAGQVVSISSSGLLGFRLRIEGRTGFQGVTRVR